MRSIVVGSFSAALLALAGCNPSPAPADTGGSSVDGGRDAATVSDTGADAPTMGDAGGECHDDYAGCGGPEAGPIVDMTGMSAVAIAANAMFKYDHPCIRVSPGTVVTITNSTTHPLAAASCSTPGGPIPAVAVPNSGTDPLAHSDYTFSAAGHYGFYCENHGADDGSGMAGLIIVEGATGADAGTDAGSDAGGADAGMDAGSDAGIDGGSDAGSDAGSDSGCNGTLLTVRNTLVWCSISVNGAAASSAPTQTVCVPHGTNVSLVATPLTGFQLGQWHHTDGDTAGTGEPGTVSGSMSTAHESVGTAVTDCVWTCCPFVGGSGCPTTDQCP